MRGIFFTQLVLSAQKRWHTIQVFCLFILALVMFCLILISSLDFFSRAFSMLLILNFSTSCVLNSEWWQEGLHLNLNPSPKQLFSSVNLCGIQNHRRRRSCAGITFPADWFLPVTICSRRPFRWQSDSMEDFTLIKLSCENCFLDSYQLLVEFVKRHLALSDCTEFFFIYETVSFEKTLALFSITIPSGPEGVCGLYLHFIFWFWKYFFIHIKIILRLYWQLKEFVEAN